MCVRLPVGDGHTLSYTYINIITCARDRYATT